MIDTETPRQPGMLHAGTDNQDAEALDIVYNDDKSEAAAPKTTRQKFFNIVTWTPPWCRWDPENPPTFSIWHNVLFAFAGAFTVGNLYYNHPILNVLAKDFNVSYVTVSRIPTLMQAGYATGLLFVCPLGDLLRRRPLTLALIAFTATMW